MYYNVYYIIHTGRIVIIRRLMTDLKCVESHVFFEITYINTLIFYIIFYAQTLI